MPAYAIVVFHEKDEKECTAMVPEGWCIEKDRCYWPPYTTTLRFEKAVSNSEPAQEGWDIHPMRILKMTDSYKNGRILLKQAEETSDLQTEPEDGAPNRKRQRKSNRRYISSDSETEDDELQSVSSIYPSPPTPPNMPSPSLNALVSTPCIRPSPWHTLPDIPTRSQRITPPSTSNFRSRISASSTSTKRLSNPSRTPAPSTSTQRLSSSSRSRTSASSNSVERLASSSRSRTSALSTSAERLASSRTRSPAPTTPSERLHLGNRLSAESMTSGNERLIIKLLTDLKHEVREMKGQLLLLTNSADQQQDLAEDYVMPEGITLPCSSVEQLYSLDEELKTNKPLQKHLFCLLSTVGGRNLATTVKRSLEEVITNTLAVKMNWSGQGTKEGFKNLTMKPILEKAIRKNKSTAESTSEEIQHAVAHFLKGAGDRDGGRSVRRDAQKRDVTGRESPVEDM